MTGEESPRINGATVCDHDPVDIPTEHTQYKTFDDVLDSLRGFGPFQWKQYILISLLKIPAGIGILLLVFVGANPGWDCVRWESDVNDTSTGNITIIANDTDDGACALDETVCERQYHEDFTSVLTEWDLVCSRDYIPTAITSILMIGIGIGSGVMGQLADTYGRRHVLFGTTAIVVVMLFLLGLAPSWQMFTFFRLLLGIGAGGIMVVGGVLPLEVVGRDKRVLVSLVTGWQLGIFLLAMTAYFVRNWRHMCFVLGAISAPVLVGWFFVPESARWLIQTGRFTEAHQVVSEMARVNSRLPPDIKTLCALAESGGPKDGGTAPRYSFCDLFRTPYWMRITITQMLLWFTASITIYGIATNIGDFGASIYGNTAILAAVDFTFYVIFLPVVERFGRKPTLLAYLSLTVICTVLITICDNVGAFDRVPRLRMIIAIIGLSGMSTAWAAGYLLVGELFPTVVRNLAMAISSIAARFGGVLAPQIAYLSFLHSSVPYVIYTVLTLGTMLLILPIPETTDCPLPDSLSAGGGPSCCCCRPQRHSDELKGEVGVPLRPADC